MRLLRAIAGLTISATLAWAVFANAQETASEEQAEPDSADTPAAAESDAVTEIPAELLESPYMDEIRVIVGPQGQTLYELQREEEERIRESIYAEMRLREREQEEVA